MKHSTHDDTHDGHGQAEDGPRERHGGHAGGQGGAAGDHAHTEHEHGQAGHDHAGHEDHAAHESHGGHADHSGHEGHDPETFRRKFWLSLALTLPILYFSEQFRTWLRYEAVGFPGSDWVNPVLGTVLFVYGGVVFLRGARHELAA